MSNERKLKPIVAAPPPDDHATGGTLAAPVVPQDDHATIGEPLNLDDDHTTEEPARPVNRLV
ncbi:hypothetical protein [Streptomyces sp. NPDC051162]|uniref:hypothetical protein n=1 Tax=unclassified Streptomyces TaxID=2593676 RepID=UPI003420861A